MRSRPWRARRPAIPSSSFPDDYEVGRILGHAGKLVRTVRDRSRSAGAIRRWLFEDGGDFGLEPLEDGVRSPHSGPSMGPSFDRNEVHRGSMADLAKRLDDHATPASVGCSPLQTNLNCVSELFELDALDAEIVGLLVRYRLHAGFQSLIDHVLDAREMKPDVLIGALIGRSATVVGDRLHPRMPLLDSGIVGKSNAMGDCLSQYYEIPCGLIESLTTSDATSADIRRALIGPILKSELTWGQFDHVGAERDLVTEVIRGANDARASGVNVLIWGRPGTGKTTMAAAVAQHLDLTLYRAGESGDSAVPDRADRLPMLRWSQRLLARQSGVLLIFDEAEDLLPTAFEMRPDASGSKVALNRLLESNPVPTIWTSNEVECFDPALLRRFTLVVELRTPPEGVRVRIWESLAQKAGLDLPPDALRGLAREFDQPPALAGNAIFATQLARGGMDQLRLALAGAVRATGRKQSYCGPIPTEPFDPDLTTADLDLVRLTDRLTRAKTRTFSLLISGLPGTGKSAYARYLAEQLEMPVISKRASDLLNAHVGDSEKAIAHAFEEARNEGALLILDEVDSLLNDRRHAVRSWEVTQVNELLTQLEAHTFPVVATTNFIDRLDPACLRRFTFKVRLEPMTPTQVRLGFRSFFGCDPTSACGVLTDLTPGDFRVVQRKANILGIEDPAELAAMLLSESEGKPNRTHPIGF
jgi:transitional endoplasmic reticulum ATPase